VIGTVLLHFFLHLRRGFCDANLCVGNCMYGDQMTARLVKLGGRVWAQFLDPRDTDRYDVMRLRLVVR
jgi:hypothetical protein